MARKKVRIFSNEYSVSHMPRNEKYGRYWLWEKNPYEKDCWIEVDVEDFNFEMRTSLGFRRMFMEDAVLYIKDADLIKEWGLQEVDEYILDVEGLKELVFEKSIEDLEDFLMYAPQSMIDNIEVVCTEKELTDTRKLKLIKDYTGKDIEEYYKDLELEGKTVEESTNQAKIRQPRKKKTQ